MSKSENQMATLYLSDTDDMIVKKIGKAITDGGPATPNAEKPDYISNLFALMALVSDPSQVEKYEEAYNNCTIRYGDMKKELAHNMVEFIKPIREKVNHILSDEKYINDIMKTGAEKARINAEKTMIEVRNHMGLNYY